MPTIFVTYIDRTLLILSSWPWDWSSSAWAALTFLVLVAAALVAWRQVSEARRLREDQARPFVIIDFHPWSTMIELKIKNVGATLARDVKFEFDPPLTTTHDDTPGRGNLMELNLFKNGIPSLVPGKEITLFFDQFPARIGQGLEMTYDVRISYTDAKGTPYFEPTVLDLSMYLGTGGITRHGIHDVHKRLEELVREVKKWSYSGGGLKVMGAEEIKQHRKELDEWYARDEHPDAEQPALAEADEVEQSEATQRADAGAP